MTPTNGLPNPRGIADEKEGAMRKPLETWTSYLKYVTCAEKLGGSSRKTRLLE